MFKNIQNNLREIFILPNIITLELITDLKFVLKYRLKYELGVFWVDNRVMDLQFMLIQ